MGESVLLSFLLAVGALLVGRLVAGLAILVVLALLMHFLDSTLVALLALTFFALMLHAGRLLALLALLALMLHASSLLALLALLALVLHASSLLALLALLALVLLSSSLAVITLQFSGLVACLTVLVTFTLLMLRSYSLGRFNRRLSHRYASGKCHDYK